MSKYDKIWLEKNNLTQEWFDEQLEQFANTIADCKWSVLRCVVTDMIMFEAILPTLEQYTFQLSKPYEYEGFPFRELTIYLK